MLAFQPHRYTRTRDCFEDFVKVLSGVDALLLRGLCRRRATHRGSRRPFVGRALRVAGTVEPVFVEDIAEMPTPSWARRKMAMLSSPWARAVGAVPGKLAPTRKQAVRRQFGKVAVLFGGVWRSGRFR